VIVTCEIVLDNDSKCGTVPGSDSECGMVPDSASECGTVLIVLASVTWILWYYNEL